MILVVDNKDTFACSLARLVMTQEYDVRMVRNDQVTVEKMAAMAPEALVLSGGPGRPSDAGACEDVVRAFAGRVLMLGVCLGHQAICEALGGQVGPAAHPVEGRATMARTGEGHALLFEGLPDAFPVARFHCLSAVERSLPRSLKVTAHSDDGEVMAVEHTSMPVFGVQFHPESTLTPDGKAMIANFVRFEKEWNEGHASR